MHHTDDTIVAIGTAPGGAARGMVRISGPQTARIVAERFTPSDGRPISQIRRAVAIPGRYQIRLSQSSAQDIQSFEIDCRLHVWPNERSYTRQPTAEVHTLGSPPIFDAIVSEACRAGARLAQPGEFTLRAFLAGRIDLTQAEAVLGVIDARDKAELDGALAQLAGGLACPLAELRDDLLQLLAELEAGLDFVDEDIEFISRSEILERLSAAQETLRDVSARLSGRATTHRPSVVLTGPPNAGKSSLFNALIAQFAADRGRPGDGMAALVSPMRGTTRDYLTAFLTIGGVEIELVDTAGIDAAGSSEQSATVVGDIDRSAQTAAIEQRNFAPFRIWCVDATLPQRPRDGNENGGNLDPLRDLVVLTKVDAAADVQITADMPQLHSEFIATSSRTGQGLDELARAIGRLLASGPAEGATPIVAATAERCRESVRLTAEALERAEQIVAVGAGDELAGAEVRAALAELGQVVGAVYTDDLLDRIFGTFCIGK